MTRSSAGKFSPDLAGRKSRALYVSRPGGRHRGFGNGHAVTAALCRRFRSIYRQYYRARSVEPKRPEEVDLDAPELDLVLVDFLTELLYRFDTRGWLTRHAELELHEKDGGWTLQGTWGGTAGPRPAHDQSVDQSGDVSGPPHSPGGRSLERDDRVSHLSDRARDRNRTAP
jgi:SHS2 domain-containing protein